MQSGLDALKWFCLELLSESSPNNKRNRLKTEGPCVKPCQVFREFIKALIPASSMAPFIQDEPPVADISTRKTARTAVDPKADPRNLEPLVRSQDTVNEIAFGLEVKCIMPLLIQGEADPEGDVNRRPVCHTKVGDSEESRRRLAYDSVAKTIGKTGEKATTILSIMKNGLNEREYWPSHWIVKKANSAEPSEDQKLLKGYVWIPIEISSPKMIAKDPETLVRVARVLDALSRGPRIATNYTCDVHVHLGRMDGQSFSLPTLKRLGHLLWFAEPTLRSIRDPASPNYHNFYTWGAELRKHSRLATQIREVELEGDLAGPTAFSAHKALQDSGLVVDQTPKDWQALRTIWKASSETELGRLLSGEGRQFRRLGFNFSAFGMEDERARSNPRTVEIRIMEGTMRSDLVVGWLVICSTLVEVAILRLDGRFLKTINRFLRQSTEEAHGDGCTEDTSETSGQHWGRKFRQLMDDLGIPGYQYKSLEEKVRREN